MDVPVKTVPGVNDVTAQPRFEQIDVLRGFAVLGIFWINIVVLGLPHGAYAYPTLFGTANTANLWTWAVGEVFVEGTMRGLFSMLFGASALIFLDEARLATAGVAAVDRYYRRNLLLMAFGMAHAYLLLWPYDVLYAYGLFGMLLFPLRRVRARWLLGVGLALLLAGDADFDVLPSEGLILVPIEGDFEESTAPRSETALRSKIKEKLELAQYEMGGDIETARAGYWTLFRDRLPVTIDQQSTQMYIQHVFDIGGMMLLGMALLKLGVLTGRRGAGVYVLLLLGGYAAALLLRGGDVYQALSKGFDVALFEEVGGINHDLGRLPGTLGHIGLIGLLCRSAVLDPVAKILGRVGRVALTNYVGQTLVSVILFFGFGLYGTLERYQLGLLCAGIWGAQILFSHLWLTRFRLGPLEWLWRSLIYGEVQPFRLQQRDALQA